MINTELMERVRQVIMMRPELHNQGMWLASEESVEAATVAQAAEAGEVCGTAGCVAGWAAIFSAPQGWYIEAASYQRNSQINTGTSVIDTFDFAKNQLGITYGVACWLFAAFRTREEVLWALKWLPDHQEAWDVDILTAWQDERLDRLR